MALRVSCALLLSAALTRADAQHVATRVPPGISATDFRSATTVAAAAAARPAPQCSLAAGSGLLRPGARYTVDLTSGGKARTFLLRLPDEPTSAMPVLLAVHGALQSATIFLDVKDGAPPEVKIDSKAAAKGFVTIAPNALCDTPLQISTCRWAETATKLDPGWATDQQFPQQSEMSFFADAVACAKTVLGVSLSGDVFALGFSQGAKLVTRFGCAGADISGGELRLRGVVAAEGFFADELAYPTCGASAGVDDVTPPPMLLFQAQQDATVPYCTSGAPYIQSAEYFNRWAAGYAGCRQTVPFGQQVLVNSPAILQALCPQGSESLVTELANASVDVTRLQRVYTNGVGCTAPLALFWTSEAGSATGHAWPSPMAALGGMDGTDVALAFFARLQGLTAPQVSSADAFQPFLAQMSTCNTVVPAGLPPFLGLSAGPCSDLQGAASNAWLS